jgi:hypothetical protein
MKARIKAQLGPETNLWNVKRSFDSNTMRRKSRLGPDEV